jgi:hypothetical protein
MGTVMDTVFGLVTSMPLFSMMPLSPTLNLTSPLPMRAVSGKVTAVALDADTLNDCFDMLIEFGFFTRERLEAALVYLQDGGPKPRDMRVVEVLMAFWRSKDPEPAERQCEGDTADDVRNVHNRSHAPLVPASHCRSRSCSPTLRTE